MCMNVFCPVSISEYAQVRADPAGNSDAEEGREFIQRAHRAADPDVPAQVTLIMLNLVECLYAVSNVSAVHHFL